MLAGTSPVGQGQAGGLRAPCPSCRVLLSPGRSAAEADPAGRCSAAAQAGAAESQHGQGGAAQPERESLLLLWLFLWGLLAAAEISGSWDSDQTAKGLCTAQAAHSVLARCEAGDSLPLPVLQDLQLGQGKLSLMFSVLLHLSLLAPWLCRWHLLCAKATTLNSSSLDLCRFLLTLYTRDRGFHSLGISASQLAVIPAG